MPRPITIEDLYSMQFLDRPRVSPNGKRIAYVVTRIDGKKHAYRSSIWVSPVSGGEARRFTQESEMTGDPAWSPDGRWLAFVAKREGGSPDTGEKEQKKLGKGKPQIWIMPSDGGEARQLTFMEHGASSPVWSPDSQKLLFSAQVGPAAKETEEGKPLPKVHVIDQLWYRLDGVGFIYDHRSHLFQTTPEGGESQQLTDGDWNDSSAAWSPDGRHITFISDREEDRWRIPGGDVYVLTPQEGQIATPRRLTDGTMSCASPSWSPDGQTIAFPGSKKVGAAGHAHLYTIAANAESSEPHNLTPEFDGTCLDFTNSDIGDEHLMPAPAWSPDGNNLYVLASYHGSTHIYKVSVADGAGKEPPTITPGNLHTRDFSIDATQKTLVMTIANATRPQEIYAYSTESQDEPRKITSFNDPLFNELQLAEPEYIRYEGADGWPIDGWILKPNNFDPNHKYPLVVEIHGGPNTQYGYGFFHEMQFLVAEGYVVLYTNPRGSCGYGFDFANAVRGAWGEKDSIDIMNGVAEVVQRGYIDTTRMGVTGGSYGGYMTNYLVTRNNRFKVAITDRCVSNMATMFGASDIGWDLGYEVLDTTPWEDLEKYMNMSPIKFVQNIRTPLLIIHSDQDLRCSIEQAEQLYTALKYMGRETRLVRFEGQSHGLSRGGHPHSRLERLRHIQSWFAKYLQ
ncbi:alpha/beta hydrolase family protein [Ktedonospora formicarum]|uniref:Putative peptidase YuxL n=1 Tax=Ktedonospora formicarum TaxID=2778364 RepID=A0A8J3I6E5_9CHLR|nr:S9 family peptidase [Ktedonospora formicarum]GHO45534.1 putative peptidase YuxL [Ktedonospora formicarum]